MDIPFQIRNYYRSLYSKIRSWGIVGIIIASITAFGAILCFYHLGNLSLWGDEIDTMMLSSPDLRSILSVLWPGNMNMSLFYFLMHFWQHLFVHPTDTELRILPALFSVASIPAVFFLGRTVSSDKWISNATGIFAALLVSLNAFHLQYAQELRSYSLVFLLATLSTILLIRAVRHEGSIKFWLGYALVSIAGVYSHYFFAFLIFAQATSLIILLIGRTRTFQFKAVILTYISIGLLIIPMVLAAHLGGAGGLSWVSKPTISSIFSFLIDITGSTNSFTASGVFLLILYIIAIVASYFNNKSSEGKEEGLLYKWIFALIASCSILPASIILILSVISTPLFVDRYLLLSLPSIAVMASFGIAKLIKTGSLLRRFSGLMLAIAMAFASISGIADYYVHTYKDDWRDTAAILSRYCASPDDLRLYYPAWTQFFPPYYNSMIATQSTSTENDLYDPESGAINAFFPGNYSEVCLVLSQGASLEDLGNTPTVLKDDFPEGVAYNLPTIEVYVYTK